MKQDLTLQKPSKAEISILVVEDDSIVRALLNAIISEKFPELLIYLAKNGQEGLNLFKERRSQIVITDINMPVMDGVEMTREIKAIDAETRVLVITAYDQVGYCEKLDQVGIEDFIVKPLTVARLFTALEKCLAGFGPAK